MKLKLIRQLKGCFRISRRDAIVISISGVIFVSTLFVVTRKCKRVIPSRASPFQVPNRTVEVGTAKKSEEKFRTPESNITVVGSECSNRRPSKDEIRYRANYWQVQAETGSPDTDGEIVVYSAFYDDRPSAGEHPWIRILGVRRLFPEVVQRMPLFCYVWYDNDVEPLIVGVDILVTGSDEYYLKGDVNYGQRLFSCPLPVDTARRTPKFVSIGERCINSTMLLPVQNPVRPLKWKHEFGICVELVFGWFPPEVIVEWIEAHALFGVTQVHIYNGSLYSNFSRSVFDYYTKKGLVNLVQMPPILDDYSIEGVRLGSPASLNDCMMRSMYSHRFVVPLDFDEFIVPRMHRNYSAMLDHINSENHLEEAYHTYAFRMAYFFQYFQPDQSKPRYSRTLRYRERTPPGDFMFGTKSFVDPRSCLSIFNHYCYLPLKETYPLAIDVNPSIAMIHHYRVACPFEPDQCEGYRAGKTLDDVALKFETILEQRVSLALKELKIV